MQNCRRFFLKDISYLGMYDVGDLGTKLLGPPYKLSPYSGYLLKEGLLLVFRLISESEICSDVYFFFFSVWASF